MHWPTELVEETIPGLVEMYNELMQLHRELWNRDMKRFGWEVISLRYGATKGRLEDAADEIADYLAGRRDSIPELDVRRLCPPPATAAHSATTNSPSPPRGCKRKRNAREAASLREAPPSRSLPKRGWRLGSDDSSELVPPESWARFPAGGSRSQRLTEPLRPCEVGKRTPLSAYRGHLLLQGRLCVEARTQRFPLAEGVVKVHDSACGIVKSL